MPLAEVRSGACLVITDPVYAGGYEDGEEINECNVIAEEQSDAAIS